MEVFKMIPLRNRMDWCETGAVFFEDRLWLMDGGVYGPHPVRQKAHDPKTGETRIFDGTEWVYYVKAEIKVFPEQEIEVWKTVKQARNHDLPIKRIVEQTDVPLKDLDTNSFIWDDRLWSIEEAVDERFKCYELMTGVVSYIKSSVEVDPVDVQITIHPVLHNGGFKYGRDCGKGWENS